MKKKLKIVAIIPAKGISKRIPGKNIKKLCGKPMISYILETAKSIKEIDRVIVSTDSDKIMSLAKKTGVEAPFLRPKKLTLDHVTTREVLDHAIDWLEKNEDYVPDYVLLLYPTSPLLKKERIVEAIDIVKKRDSDSVFSGYLNMEHHWIEVEGGWVRLYPQKQVNTQYKIPLVTENGAIYITKTKFIKRQYVADKADVLIMEKDENIDVDYPSDFKKVEEILSKNK